jgi:hypothetical protein
MNRNHLLAFVALLASGPAMASAYTWRERPEWPQGPVFFALNIDMPNGAKDLPKRERIARAVLRSIGALPTDQQLAALFKKSFARDARMAGGPGFAS